MNYFFYLTVRRFYVSALEAGKPDLAGKPLVVFAGRRVLDVNEAAYQLGARVGMSLSEARASVRDATFLPWSQDEFRAAQEEVLEVCARFTDWIEPETQHSAFLDLSAHPQPHRAALELLAALDKRHDVVCACSRLKWLAKAASLGSPEGVLTDARDVLKATAVLPVSRLLPAEPADRERLKRLGCRTIAEVARLPLNVLRSQFGQAGLTISQAACGGGFEPVHAAYPPASLMERTWFESPIESLDLLAIGVVDAAQRVASRLAAAEKQSKHASLEIEMEEGGPVSVKRTFARRMVDERSVQTAFHLLLSSALPNVSNRKARIRSVRLSLSRLEPVQATQASLVGPVLNEAAALASVREAFGENAVRLASQIPEDRRVSVMRAWREATGWR